MNKWVGIVGLVIVVAIMGSMRLSTRRRGAVQEAAVAEQNPVEKKLAAEIKKLPLANTRVFLYSLDPITTGKIRENDTIRDARQRDEAHATESDRRVAAMPLFDETAYTNRFEGFVSLGDAELKSMADKTALKDALTKALELGLASTDCGFEPRHGVRFVNESGTNDLLICFKCGMGYTHGFLIGDSSLVVDFLGKTNFEWLREKYKLPKSPEWK